MVFQDKANFLSQLTCEILTKKGDKSDNYFIKHGDAIDIASEVACQEMSEEQRLFDVICFAFEKDYIVKKQANAQNIPPTPVAVQPTIPVAPVLPQIPAFEAPTQEQAASPVNMTMTEITNETFISDIQVNIEKQNDIAREEMYYFEPVFEKIESSNLPALDMLGNEQEEIVIEDPVDSYEKELTGVEEKYIRQNSVTIDECVSTFSPEYPNEQDPLQFLTSDKCELLAVEMKQNYKDQRFAWYFIKGQMKVFPNGYAPDKAVPVYPAYKDHSSREGQLIALRSEYCNTKTEVRAGYAPVAGDFIHYSISHLVENWLRRKSSYVWYRHISQLSEPKDDSKWMVTFDLSTEHKRLEPFGYIRGCHAYFKDEIPDYVMALIKNEPVDESLVQASFDVDDAEYLPWQVCTRIWAKHDNPTRKKDYAYYVNEDNPKGVKKLMPVPVEQKHTLISSTLNGFRMVTYAYKKTEFPVLDIISLSKATIETYTDKSVIDVMVDANLEKAILKEKSANSLADEEIEPMPERLPQVTITDEFGVPSLILDEQPVSKIVDAEEPFTINIISDNTKLADEFVEIKSGKRLDDEAMIENFTNQVFIEEKISFLKKLPANSVHLIYLDAYLETSEEELLREVYRVSKNVAIIKRPLAIKEAFTAGYLINQSAIKEKSIIFKPCVKHLWFVKKTNYKPQICMLDVFRHGMLELEAGQAPNIRNYIFHDIRYMMDFIVTFTKEFDIVLDMSNTVGGFSVAAKRLNRHFITCIQSDEQEKAFIKYRLEKNLVFDDVKPSEY